MRWETERQVTGYNARRAPIWAEVPRYDVVERSKLKKLEHMVPKWGVTGEHTHFYVNKFASFC